MKVVLLFLALFVVLASANNGDGVVYDAFQNAISSTVYMYQRYVSQDCTTVLVTSETAVLEYNIDFSREVAKTVRIQLGADYAAGVVTQILVRLDSETAAPIATVIVTDTGSFDTFLSFSAAVSPPPSGAIHRVYFTFTSNAPGSIANLLNFQFFA